MSLLCHPQWQETLRIKKKFREQDELIRDKKLDAEL